MTTIRQYADLDGPTLEVFQRYAVACDAVEKWEAERDQLKKALLAIIGDAEGGAHDGIPLFNRSHYPRTGYDWKALRERYPDLAEQYRRPDPTWVDSITLLRPTAVAE